MRGKTGSTLKIDVYIPTFVIILDFATFMISQIYRKSVYWKRNVLITACVGTVFLLKTKPDLYFPRRRRYLWKFPHQKYPNTCNSIYEHFDFQLKNPNYFCPVVFVMFRK